MKKNVSVLLLMILFAGCSTMKNTKENSLEGQKWTYSKIIQQGIGFGNEWSFLPNNKFTEDEWYSGGMYWKRNYSGTYFYNEDTKTIFLKYKKKNAPLSKQIKTRLDLKITENDTVLTITKGWEKPEEIPTNKNDNKSVFNVIESYTFKIEK